MATVKVDESQHVFAHLHGISNKVPPRCHWGTLRAPS